MLTRSLDDIRRNCWPVLLVVACGCVSSLRGPSEAQLLEAMAGADAEDIAPDARQTSRQRDYQLLDKLVADPKERSDLKNKFATMTASQRQTALDVIMMRSDHEEVRAGRVAPTAQRVVTDEPPKLRVKPASHERPAQALEVRPAKGQSTAKDAAPEPPQVDRPPAQPNPTDTSQAPGQTPKPPLKQPQTNATRPSSSQPNLSPSAPLPPPTGLLGSSPFAGGHQHEALLRAELQRSKMRSQGLAHEAARTHNAAYVVPAKASPDEVGHPGSGNHNISRLQQPMAEGTWHDALKQAIFLLEKKLYDEKAPKERTEAEARQLETALYVLYAAAKDDRSDAEMWSQPGDMGTFWRHLLVALNTQMNNENGLSPSLQSEKTLAELRNAERMLARVSPLKIRNVTFCDKVDGYGVYSKFKEYEFYAGQNVILYFEVDNFVARAAQGDRYETRLRGSYNIVDESGRQSGNREYPVATEYCRNYRRDYFLRYLVPIPEQLRPGTYTLNLVVTDELRGEFTEASIGFRIR